MTCEECRAVIDKLPDGTASEIVYSFMHCSDCAECSNYNISRPKLPLSPEKIRKMAETIAANALNDPELQTQTVQWHLNH